MKKGLSILLVIALMVTMAIPLMGAGSPPEKLTWVDGFGFHCNAAKGNGATDVINLLNDRVVAKGSQKDVFGVKANPIGLERVGNTTTWNLLTNDIECATCGRIDWVTFSNNNGKISGKNIQANHSGTPRYIAEVSIFWTTEILECEWECEGVPCTFECDVTYGDDFVCICEKNCSPCDPCGCIPHECLPCECAAKDAGFVETIKVVVPSAFSYDYAIEGFTLVNITDNKGNVVEFPAQLPAAKASYSFTFNFVANGDCACDFEACTSVCGCDPCGGFSSFDPPVEPPVEPPVRPPVCQHLTAVCDECKGGNGNNCSNCVNVNQPNSNTNFFCLDCGVKVGQRNPNNLGNPNVTWGVQECACPKCCPHD